MGIKTRFNPMGGRNEKGNLSQWRYSTAGNGQITLYEYLGTYSSVKPLYVPVKGGKTVINNYTSGSSTTASNTPFYNNPNVISVDLQNVPFKDNSMSRAFYNCQNLTSGVGINQNVTGMVNTFSYCTNFNQNIQIPNSVTNMANTFLACYNLNQNIQIPNNVTNMVGTFDSCTSLNQNIQIPSSVITMSNTFFSCYNLQGTITIQSPFTASTSDCFNGSGLTKNVIFPSRYINNTYTITRNSLVSAGYAVGTAVGNSVNNTTQNAVFTAYDPVSWEGYNAWVGDGVNWRLTKWGGIGKAAGQTSIKVPTSITSYDTFPTVISNTCFDGVTGLTEIDCQHVPIFPATSTNFFGNIDKTCYVYNFNCDSTEQMYALIYMSPGIHAFSTGTPQRGTFFLNMPVEVNNAQAMCGHAKYLSNFYLTGNEALKTYSLFNGCNRQSINVHLNYSAEFNGTNRFRDYSSSYCKNIFIYYTYNNGVATNAYNSFKGTAYMGTTGNAVTIASPHYNTSSNFYVYNMSQDYCPTNNPSWWCCPVNGALRYTGVGYSDDTPITFPTSLSVQQYPDKYVTVTTNTQDMSNMFNGFFKINTPVTIPEGVTNMSGTFYDCTNLNQNIQIPNSATNMVNTFYICTNLNGDITIFSNQVANAYRCFLSYDTSSTKNVYLPFKYSNGVNSATFNSFVSAGYLYANGVSNDQHGVTVHDLNT